MTPTARCEPSITLAEARELVAASVAARASENDVRLLLIKGPTLASHGLRDPRESVDVDVLIAPDELTTFIRGLESSGWHPYALSPAPPVIPEHSVTLVHERWPLELDVHHRFPGFLAEPQRVFDEFWKRRQQFQQAHQLVAMPDLASSILVAALNYERDPVRCAGTLDSLRERSRKLLSQDQVNELADLARQTGCADTLHEFLDALGAPSVGVGEADPTALAAWHLYQTINTIAGSGGSVLGVAWFEEIRRSRWHRRPAILWRALMLTENDLRGRFPQAPEGRRGVWLARYWRLKRALSSVPGALRVVWRAARTG